MSSVFDLDESGQKAQDDEARLRVLDPRATLGAFAGAGEAAKGLMYPSAQAARALTVVGAVDPIFKDAAVSFITGQRTTALQENYFRQVTEQFGEAAVDYWKPNPEVMGSASKLLNVGGSVVGSLPQIIAAPQLFLGAQAIDPATEVVNKGGSLGTAAAVGAINLAANAVGFKIPAAFGQTLLTRAATGAGANLAVGIASDAATAEVLRQGGLEDMAAGYNWDDPTARLLDAALGAAFGYKAHVDALPEVPQAQRDAVLATNNNDNLMRRSMPGVPLDAAAARDHVKAMNEAIGAVLASEPVELGDAITRRVQVEPQVAGPAIPADYEQFRRTLESGGRADAANPRSSATGIDQFTASTWRRVVAQEQPAWAQGLSDEQVLAARLDPEKSGQMAAALDRGNAAALEAAGQPVTGHNLYAAHHFGEKRGVAFAEAAGDTPMREILSPSQIDANPYLRDLTKDQAIANWDERAARGGAALEAQMAPDLVERTPFADLDETSRRQFAETARAFELSPEAVDALSPRAARDGVTGYFDGRLDQVKSTVIDDAIAHVTRTGEPAQFVSADLYNLGGLNAHVGNRAEAANVHFRAFADILDQELRATGADVVPMRTGGDELGVAVVNADATAVHEAVFRAQDRIAEYSREQGLADIPHPKRSGEKGVGLHVGVAEIDPGRSVREILDRADDGVNLSKLGAAPDVPRQTTQPAGAQSPGRRPAGAAGGDAAARGGVRPGQAGRGSPAQGADGAGGEGRPADAEALKPQTPVEQAAQIAAENPDAPVLTGFDADGNPIIQTMAQALAQIEAERQIAVRESNAYSAAVSCFMRSGG